MTAALIALAACILAAWLYAPRLCARLADAAEAESRPLAPAAPIVSLTARLRAPRLADVTAPADRDAWDALAGEEPWRSVLRRARGETMRRAA